jgi:hypothetical protein
MQLRVIRRPWSMLAKTSILLEESTRIAKKQPQNDGFEDSGGHNM